MQLKKSKTYKLLNIQKKINYILQIKKKKVEFSVHFS